MVPSMSASVVLLLRALEEKGGKAGIRGMREIIHLLHYTVVKYSALKYPIMLDIGETSFNDKLVYIVLECVIHIVMEKYHRKVFTYQDYCDKKYFSDKYSEKDFYNISSFQDKISGSI